MLSLVVTHTLKGESNYGAYFRTQEINKFNEAIRGVKNSQQVFWFIEHRYVKIKEKVKKSIYIF